MKLLGRWECISADDPSPGPMTILDFDGKQYFRLVDPQPFEDVIDDGPSVSARLGNHLQDPEVVREFLSCARTEASK